MRITDYLEADHRRIEDLFESACSNERFDPLAFARFRASLLRHIAIEEKLLMVAVREMRGDQPLNRAHQLRIEHGAISSLLVPPPDLDLCKEIQSLLDPHSAKEEGPDGVYAECEQVLGERSESLGVEAAAYPQVRVAPYRSLPGMSRTAAQALASARRIRPLQAKNTGGN